MDNKYLLIKGGRIDQFQPLGGVFHYFDSFSEIKNSLNISDVTSSQFHDKNDLRIFVPGNNVLRVVDWFHSRKNRECTVTREFIEELVDPGVLGIQDLKEVQFEFKKSIETGIRFSEPFKMNEYNIYEIYKVTFSNKLLETKILENTNNNKQYLWCDNLDIEATKISLDGLDRKIGQHSKYIV
ncbi:SMODS-associated NUDIX domain-containing protein [Enterococcus bulliens]